MNQASNDARAAREWVTEAAVPLAGTGSPKQLVDLVGDAVIIGFGESTRQSHEILDLGHRLLRSLVEEKGFRALAIGDDSSVIAELDDYARTGDGDPRQILFNAFAPWRITEMVELVEWMRSFNQEHPDDPVRMFGLQPPVVRDAHYDVVIERLRAAAPQLVTEVAGHYGTIRTAHRIGEHVQRSQGIHPGRPFAELAREAFDLIATLDDEPTVDLARRILAFHDNSVAAGVDFDQMSIDLTKALTDWHDNTGHKILFWEGIAHTANAEKITIHKWSMSLHAVGHRLRQHFGDRYVSIGVGFDHGCIHDDVTIPPPPSDFADAVLGVGEPETYLLDLRSPKPEPVARWLSGQQHKLRIIAGIYKPEEDAEHFLTGGPLDGWFDAVVRVREITPTTMVAPG